MLMPLSLCLFPLFPPLLRLCPVSKPPQDPGLCASCSRSMLATGTGSGTSASPELSRWSWALPLQVCQVTSLTVYIRTAVFSNERLKVLHELFTSLYHCQINCDAVSARIEKWECSLDDWWHLLHTSGVGRANICETTLTKTKKVMGFHFCWTWFYSHYYSEKL